MYGTPQLVHVRLCASWTHPDELSRSSLDAVKVAGIIPCQSATARQMKHPTDNAPVPQSRR